MSLEGLRGQVVDTPSGRLRITSIKAHGEARRQRTVFFSGGYIMEASIYDLVGLLIERRG